MFQPVWDKGDAATMRPRSRLLLLRNAFVDMLAVRRLASAAACLRLVLICCCTPWDRPAAADIWHATRTTARPHQSCNRLILQAVAGVMLVQSRAGGNGQLKSLATVGTAGWRRRAAAAIRCEEAFRRFTAA